MLLGPSRDYKAFLSLMRRLLPGVSWATLDVEVVLQESRTTVHIMVVWLPRKSIANSVT